LFKNSFQQTEDQILSLITKYGTNPQSASFASIRDEIEYYNLWADFWRSGIGVNIIPAQTNIKKTFISWCPWKDNPIPESQHVAWKNQGAFKDGTAIMAGKVWHRPDKAGQYFIIIDLDSSKAIQEFCTRKEKTTSLHEIALKFIVEQHMDDNNRAHVCFYSPIPFPKKSSDAKIGIEIKDLSYSTPSIHQNRNPSDPKQYRYQMLVKPLVPITLSVKQAVEMVQHINSICLENGIQYLEKDYRFNKLKTLTKTLRIDPSITIPEGERHLSLLSAADSLLLMHLEKGKTETSLKNFFKEINQMLCIPEPLPDSELNDIWKSAIDFVGRIREAKNENAREKQGNGTLIEIASEEIMKKYRFVTITESKEILYYKDGVYVTGGDITIEKEAELLYGYSLSNKTLSEIKGHIMRHTYRSRSEFDTDIRIINMKNGLYNIETDELKKHSPDYMSLVQMPRIYNRDSKPKLFGKFLKEVLYPREIRTAVEAIAYSLWRDNPFEIINVLFGYGSNGKGVFVGVMTSLHGTQNISNVPLYSIMKNPFALSDLEGKNINVDTELSSSTIHDTAIMKKLTGRQPVRIERKNQRAYDTRLYAKLFFNANKIPETDDTSDAYYRRNNIISFPNKFEDGVADPDLLFKLTTEEELSGIFNVLMIALRRLLKNKCLFVSEKTIHQRREKYELALNPIGSFIKDAVAQESVESDRVIKDEFYHAYKRFCKEKRLAVESKENFGKILKSNVYGYQDGREASGARKTIWKGIRLTEKYEIEVEQQTLAI
jgi:putative DNA primase/helicase